MNEVTQLNLRVSATMARLARTLAASGDKTVPEFVEGIFRYYLQEKDDPQLEKQRRKDVELARILTKGKPVPFDDSPRWHCRELSTQNLTV